MNSKMITSEGNPSVFGEINLDSERVVDLRGKHTIEEWLVFTDEEIGHIPDTVKDTMKNYFPANRTVNLKDFTELMFTTMNHLSSINMDILKSLEEKVKELE